MTTTEKLTREQILAEPAGRRMNCWIAEHVMHFPSRRVRPKGETGFVEMYGDNPAFADGWWDAHELRSHGEPPPYSTQITAAWQVVEKANAEWWEAEGGHGDPIIFCFAPTHKARADTLPLAICRAALLFVLDL